MTPYKKHTSEVCIRLVQDMKIRNFAVNTIDAYTCHVDKFERFLGSKNILEATPEDIRSFQLHLIEVRKVGFSSFNQAVCGLRLLYSVTIPKNWPVVMIPFGKRAKKLPTVLSDTEVAKLLECTPNLKHRTFFTTLYAAGLRLSYATGLLEAGVDILTISRLLGHASFSTTMVYLHVRRTHLLRTPSPLDWLPTRQLPRWEDPTKDPPSEN